MSPDRPCLAPDAARRSGSSLSEIFTAWAPPRFSVSESKCTMTRNFLYFLIVIFTLGAAYVGYQYYLESQEGIGNDRGGISTDRN
jgi:hypothetical protein